MAQYLKDEVRKKIQDAALAVFAESGYLGATMADIARAAHVSTGNLYRYYEDKATLFEDVIKPELARRFRRLVHRRVRALDGIEDYRTPELTETYRAVSIEVARFVIEHRREMIVLLGRARGTRYEGFSEQVEGDLASLAVAHFRSLRPDWVVTETMRFNLKLIYRNFIVANVSILEAYEDEAGIRAAMDDYARYHLAGLKDFFGG